MLERNKVLGGIENASGENSVTWHGHMTAMLQIDGKVILTDPWFNSYATPLPPFEPKRYVSPPVEVSELPKVDFIVISHNHFDHLDLATIEDITNKKNYCYCSIRYKRVFSRRWLRTRCRIILGRKNNGWENLNLPLYLQFIGRKDRHFIKMIRYGPVEL